MTSWSLFLCLLCLLRVKLFTFAGTFLIMYSVTQPISTECILQAWTYKLIYIDIKEQIPALKEHMECPFSPSYDPLTHIMIVNSM